MSAQYGPNFPRVEELAQIIADHYDADLGLADVEPPNAADIELARVIRNRFYQGVYFTNLSDDHSGIIAGFRRLIWPLIVIAAVVIAVTAIVLWPNEGAH